MGDPGMTCTMTGIQIRDCGDGIYDDGEWISWEYINRQLAIQDGEFVEEPSHEPVGKEIQWLLMEAIHDENHGVVPSPKWGRIGELYVAERFGVVLSRTGAQGHDGHLDNELVEIKTITPNKRRPFVRVKRSGNFSLLAVVRVNAEHEFEARLVRRGQLNMAGEGRFTSVGWQTVCALAEG